MEIDVLFSYARFKEIVTVELAVELFGEPKIETSVKTISIFLTKDGEYFDDLDEAARIIGKMTLAECAVLAQKIGIAQAAHQAMQEDPDD